MVPIGAYLVVSKVWQSRIWDTFDGTTQQLGRTYQFNAMHFSLCLFMGVWLFAATAACFVARKNVSVRRELIVCCIVLSFGSSIWGLFALLRFG